MQAHEHDATPQTDLGPKHARLQIRLVAGLVDLVALAAPAYLVISLFFGIGWGLGGDEGELITIPNLVNTAILMAITVLLWVNWDGRTPGKKLTRIRLASYPDYGGIGYWPALIRSLIGALSAFTVIGYVVIAVMVGIRKDKRGYHDLIAKTCVVHDEPN